MPRTRQVWDDGTSRYRFSGSDVFWALFMIAWTTLGAVAIGHDVEEYRWQQRVIAEFNARMPQEVVAIPYDPAVLQRLIGEAAGCLITIVAVTMGIGRRGPVQLRVKWIAPVQATVSAPAMHARAGAARKGNSGSLAAERLSAVVWHDHAARVDKDRL